MFKYQQSVLTDELLDSYRRAYEFEIERKDSFGNKLSFSFAVITLVVGAMTAMLTKTPSTACGWTIAFKALLVLTYISLGGSLFCLWRAAAHRPYAYLSNIKNIDEQIQQMHQVNVTGGAQYDIVYEFNNFLANRYRDAASVNRETNRIRTGWFTRTFTSLYFTVAFLFVLIGIATVCRWQETDGPQKIEITSANITSLVQPSIRVATPLQLQPITINSWPTQLQVSASVSGSTTTARRVKARK